MTIVLIGCGALFAALAAGVAASGQPLAAVISPDPLPAGCRGRPRRLARRGVNRPATLARLGQLAPDLVLVGSWAERLEEPLLALPRLGCVNCHPSLLPRHRGSNPYLSAVVSGERVSGVTFHRMVRDWDAGPILLQQSVAIEDADTGGELRDRCARTAQGMVAPLLSGLAAGALPERAQDAAAATCFPEPGERDREVDWQLPARSIHDRIRGMLPWYRCYSYLGEGRVSFGASRLARLPTPTRSPGEILAVRGDAWLVGTGDPDCGVWVGAVREEGRCGSWGGGVRCRDRIGRRFARRG